MLGSPPEGPVRVFASLLPPALVFGVQSISGVLLLANSIGQLLTFWLTQPEAPDQ
jgi:hypothetical protein